MKQSLKLMYNTHTYLFLKILLFACGAFLFARCSESKTVIYSDEPFEEIRSNALHKESPFCLVLVDSSKDASRDYLKHLHEDYGHLTDKAIYNIIDLTKEENKWYVKWLCPISTPLACVFSSEGDLIDLIPGISKESFLYTGEALQNVKVTDFHWPNRFQMNKKQVIPYLDNLLKQKINLDNGIYLSTEFNQIIDSLYYPYPIYLKLIGECMENDTIGSLQTAKSMIEIETPSFLESYKSEFIMAKKVLDPNFDINTEPNIRVEETMIFLDKCEVNQKELIDINIYNDGKQPLRISKIHLSCSCLEQIGCDTNIMIDPQDYYTAKFYFTPDVGGEISRDIFITSNAINTPILHINILANATNSMND